MPDPSRRTPLPRRLLRAAIGELRWSPPRWPNALGERLFAGGGALRRHPLLVMGSISVLLSLTLLVGKAVVWYSSRPRPTELSVVAAPLAPTPIAKLARPAPLTLRFSGSAAPIEAIGKPVARGATLSPQIAGYFRWQSDRELRFTPAGDWPIGRTLEIELEPRLHSESVRLDRYSLRVETPRFELAIDEARLHEDPRDPAQKRVVATLRFSHPVEAASLVRRLRLALLGRPPLVVPATLSYDALRARAFVQSAPLAIPEQDRVLELELSAGVRAASGGPGTRERKRARVPIPGRDSLRIESARVGVVVDDEGRPSHRIVVEANRCLGGADLGAALSAYLLPREHPLRPARPSAAPHAWDDVSAVSPEILRRSERLTLAPPTGPAGTTLGFQAARPLPVGRTLYLVVRRGLRSAGGYRLPETRDALAPVPPFPPLLKVVHSGAVLALHGAKRIAIVTRDLAAVRLQVGRVLPAQLHHLVAANRGTFASPYLRGLSDESLSEVFREVRTLAALPPGKSQELEVDLGRYLEARGRERRGLFLLRAEGFDPARGEPSSPAIDDRRLVLVTDLGVLVKDAADGSHDLFVVSLSSGSPVAGARVELLGRNGQPLASTTTDREGRARLAALPARDGAEEPERAPTVYLVRRGADLSFLPYGRSERYLDTSRFDVGGVRDRGDPRGLTAYLFSDRGLYRPGDEARFAAIVKPRDWSAPALAGLPLELSLSDPRGRELRRETIRLGQTGFEEVRHRFSRTARAGLYRLSLRLVRDGKPEGLLGQTGVEVREFEPDRMRIKLALSTTRPQGWLPPGRLAAIVSLENLFGTPAAGRRVRGRLTLHPRAPVLPRFPDHRFQDRTQKETLRVLREELPEVRTDERGRAALPLRLERFSAASYGVEVEVEGFEAEGGRSVSARIGAAISPLPYLVGYRGDGSLELIPRGSTRSVELRAVGPEGTAVAASGLHIELRKKVFRSVLARQPDGTYRYQSLGSEVPRWRRPLGLPATGSRLRLPTDEPGEYLLLLHDGAGEHNRLAFSVAGDENLARSLERESELELALEKDDVAPGDELKVQIKSPFRSGYGLMTIERERVHAFRWFKLASETSLQTIRLPAGAAIEGNGYLTVTLVRSSIAESEAVRGAPSAPLSHGIVGFTVRRQKRTVKVELEAPAQARAGEPLRVRVRTDRPARLVLFAVDEGILRVARYTLPDPLGHFLRKRALEVRTAGILDLILPEASGRASRAAPGGGDEGWGAGGGAAANRNPFARRHRPALAFWSGILDASSVAREVAIPIPDEFGGAVRVMAVAVAPQAMGVARRLCRVRGEFVLSPHAPGFVAPGDEFEVGLAVANTPPGAVAGARRPRPVSRVALELGATSELEVLGPSRVALEIPELEERSTRFRLRARERLGVATLRFLATSGARRSRHRLEVSVRPATPYLTALATGSLPGGGRGQVVVDPRRFYPEERVLRAGISSLPLAFADGLRAQLERFPHGCTEQLVSKAVPALVLADRADWGGDAAAAGRALGGILATLRERQNEEGAFGLWAANPSASPFATTHAILLLLEAKERGHALPEDLLDHGLGYLRAFAAGRAGGRAEERLRARAIYLLARAEVTSGTLATALQRRLDEREGKTWRGDIAAAYLAASYQLLRETGLAEELIRGLRFGAAAWVDSLDPRGTDGMVHDAELLYLLSRHFPERLVRVGQEGVAALAASIERGRESTLSSALTILALDAHARARRATGTRHAANELLAPGARPLALAGRLFARGAFSPEAKALRFEAGAGGAFYTVIQAGYERELPRVPLKRGLEVHRELLDEAGRPVAGRVRLGQPLTARVRLRALGRGVVGGIAIVDLLPGGFDPILTAASGSPLESASSFKPESSDALEDRLLFYGEARPELRELRYRLRPTVAGRFRLPPIKAEALYDRSRVARGVGGELVVER